MNRKPCCHENTICQEKLARAWKLAEHVQLAMATLFDNKSSSSVVRLGRLCKVAPDDDFASLSFPPSESLVLPPSVPRCNFHGCRRRRKRLIND